MIQTILFTSILLAGAPSSADTTFVGRYAIPAEGETYGGLSALHISNDGMRLTAVSDRGGFMTGDISRNAGGQITDIVMDPPVAIDGYSPNPPDGEQDAESIAVAADGTIYVSFERDHRIGSFTAVDAPEQDMLRLEGFAPVADNTGIEALAIDDSGALYAIPERTRRRRDPFPVLRYADGAWTTPYAIPRTEGFLVSGADFGPDGRLYLLERAFNGYRFLTRVRRIDFETATAETILETGIGVHANLEGISVWENPAGETIMTLIADDNYLLLLSNEVAEYRIDG